MSISHCWISLNGDVDYTLYFLLVLMMGQPKKGVDWLYCNHALLIVYKMAMDLVLQKKRKKKKRRETIHLKNKGEEIAIASVGVCLLTA